MKRVKCKCKMYHLQQAKKIIKYKRKYAGNNTNCREISFELSQSAMKFQKFKVALIIGQFFDTMIVASTYKEW